MPRGTILVLVLVLLDRAAAGDFDNRLTIPVVADAPKRAITIDDTLGVRQVDTLSISPNGRQFAIFLRRADPSANRYRTGWLVGDVAGGKTISVGDGGELRPRVRASGQIAGEVLGSESRWSPDGRLLAYTLQSSAGVQLWTSQADGAAQQQLTENPADVHEFYWSNEGAEIYFNVGATRRAQEEYEEARRHDGYSYDRDLYDINDLMRRPVTRLDPEHAQVWVANVRGRSERLATEAERLTFNRLQSEAHAGTESDEGYLRNAVVPPTVSKRGGSAWLIRSGPTSTRLQLVARLNPDHSTVTCQADPCVGAIKKVWWSQTGSHVLFWRSEGISDEAHGFYSWNPSTGDMKAVFHTDDDLKLCELAAGDRVLCVRETKRQPVHLAVVDLRSSSLRMLVDLNPEFRNIQLGRIERIEWSTPAFSWNESGPLKGLYPSRAYGYILFPPDFDPSVSYPVFIEPYLARGFNGSVGSEHALHVYAANGFVVLNTEFPMPTDVAARLGKDVMRQLYSAALDFPHLAMLSESTVHALDVVAKRGFIDLDRVGIGGVSHGSFIPLYILQKHDRIRAISISSPGWSGEDYYWGTKRGRGLLDAVDGAVGYEEWRVKPEGSGLDFWRRIDIAYHVDAIEAPILMNLADQEAYAMRRFIKHLVDAGKPYDAYVFSDETHLKWQPAHLAAIMHRNLDWFRFWLQSREDSEPKKKDQYVLWRQLKQSMQCKEDINAPHC